MTGRLLLIVVVLFATGCSHSRSARPERLASLVLHYTPHHRLVNLQSQPPTETRRVVCVTPLSPLCSAAIYVARHGAGDRTCVGTFSQPAEMLVSGTVYGRSRHADLRGCSSGFPSRMQHAVNRLFAAFIHPP